MEDVKMLPYGIPSFEQLRKCTQLHLIIMQFKGFKLTRMGEII